MNRRQFFKEAYKAGYKKALKEATIKLNYQGDTDGIDSFSTSTQSDYEFDRNPPDPTALTQKDKKAIYDELRYQELIAFALGLGWKADQINSIRDMESDINQDDPMDYGRPHKGILTDDLRRALRIERGSKNKLRSKIDKKDILEMCKMVYDTAVKLTLKNTGRLKITNARTKIRQCAQELRKKVCNSVATSLSNRRELSGWERTMNNLAGIRHLGKVLADPLGAGKPVYPYSEDY